MFGGGPTDFFDGREHNIIYPTYLLFIAEIDYKVDIRPPTSIHAGFRGRSDPSTRYIRKEDIAVEAEPLRPKTTPKTYLFQGVDGLPTKPNIGVRGDRLKIGRPYR